MASRVAAYQVTPHAGFAHGGVGGLPLPVHPTQLITRLNQHGPDPRQETALAPPLEVPVHRAIVAKLRGQLVPLAASAQTEDDAIEDAPEIHPPMPRGLGRIVFIQNRLEKRPDVIGNFPDGRLLPSLGSLLAHDNPPFR